VTEGHGEGLLLSPLASGCHGAPQSPASELDRRLLPEGSASIELTEEQIAAGAGPDPAPARAFLNALGLSLGCHRRGVCAVAVWGGIMLLRHLDDALPCTERAAAFNDMGRR
jgi:hypothetical protein